MYNEELSLADILNKTDADYEKDYLRLDAELEKNVKLAQEKRNSLPPETIRELRRKAKTDLFFLTYSILGYDRLSPDLHGHLCMWMEKNKGWRFKEVLLPRAHFKSTVITIADVIQTILPDDVGDQPHPYNLGPDARVLICHEVATMASGYLYSITQHFMSNPLLMALFPECIPSARKQKINTHSLELPRQKIWNEPTVGTMGVGGKSQGLHYDKIVFDDLIGEAARDSETVMASAKLWFDGISGFFVKLRESVFTIVGTRWGPEDLYSHVENRYGGSLRIYRRSIEEPDFDKMYKDEKGVMRPTMRTIFPEEIGQDDLIILKKNPIVFAAQYMNDPSGGNLQFEPEWIKSFEWVSNTLIRVKDSLPFQSKILRVADLNKLVLVDPALKGGLTGWCVVGTDAYKRHFILEAHQERIEPQALMQKWFQLYAKWRFRALVIEEVLFSALYAPWIDAEFRLRGTRFNVIMLPTRQKQKEQRVLGLSHDLSSGNMFFNDRYYSRTQDQTQDDSDLIYQIKKFGAIKDYHILDALAQLPFVASPARDVDWEKRRVEQERQKLQRSISGYSQIKYRT